MADARQHPWDIAPVFLRVCWCQPQSFVVSVAPSSAGCPACIPFVRIISRMEPYFFAYFYGRFARKNRRGYQPTSRNHQTATTTMHSTVALTGFASAVSALVHPGALHTAADFSRIAAKVKASAEPWLTGWNKLTANSHASLDYVARPTAAIYRGSDGTHSENYPLLYNDAAAAYQLAVRWKISGDTDYAEAAVDVLNGWGSTLKLIGGSSDRFLAAGLYGYQMANAAEIMRTYSGWASSDFNTFVAMMNDVFYVANHDFLVNHNGAAIDHYWANWDLCNIASVLSIGILSNNQTMYDEGLEYFKTGAGNGAITKAAWKLYSNIDGQTLAQWQESGRDQGHSVLGIGLIGTIAQIAYNQGDDMFAYLSNRILAGAEYVAKYNVGKDVPYTTYTNSDVTQTVISADSRGTLRPNWELLYNHYAKRASGLNTTWTKSMRDLVVSNGSGAEGGGGNYGTTSGGYDSLGFGTLLYTL